MNFSALKRVSLPILLGVLGLALFAAFGGRTYSRPSTNRISEARALDRARALLGKLVPDIPSGGEKLIKESHYDSDARDFGWTFGFRFEKDRRLYQIGLSESGRLRHFAAFRGDPPPPDTPVLDRELARQRVRELIANFGADLDYPEIAGSKETVNEKKAPTGVMRRTVGWEKPLENNGAPATHLLEFTFEGNELRGFTSRFLRPEKAERERPGKIAMVVLGILIVLGTVGWMLVAFIKGVVRREIGSKAMLAAAAIHCLFFCALLGGLIAVTIATDFTTDATIKEDAFLAEIADSQAPRPPVQATGGIREQAPDDGTATTPKREAGGGVRLSSNGGILVGIGVGVFFLLLIGIPLFATVFALSEACDWEGRGHVLDDLARILRRRALPWLRVREMYLNGLGLALWLIGVETVLARFAGDGATHFDLLKFSRFLAAGVPTEIPLKEILAWFSIAALWWLPVTMLLVRRGLSATRIAIVMATLTLCVDLSGTLPDLLSGWLVTASVVWVLIEFGWVTAAFGLLAVNGLFPVLWLSLNPAASFTWPSFAVVPVLLLPVGLGLLRSVLPRKARTEDHDLAPPYVRNRLNRERLRDELDVRWTIHQNLIPMSGLTFFDDAIAVEYFHTPDRGREFFTFIPLDRKRIGIALGEVSGEGLEASMLLAVALTALKSKALRYRDNPARVIERMNTFLAPRLSESNARIQLVYAIADFERREIILCNAGYVPPVRIFSEADRSPSVALLMGEIESPPIGHSIIQEFSEKRWTFAPGEKLVLTSNWLWELFEAEAGAIPIEQRLVQEIVPLHAGTSREIVRDVVAQAHKIREALGKPPTEITTLCLQF